MVSDGSIPVHVTSWNYNDETSTPQMQESITGALGHIQDICSD